MIDHHPERMQPMKNEDNNYPDSPPVIAHHPPESIENPQYFHEIDPLCSTELYHQTVSEQSNYSLKSNPKPQIACSTSVCHQNARQRVARLFGNCPASPSLITTDEPSKNACASLPPVGPDRRSHGRRKIPWRNHGLIVRGRSFYVRWKIPKALQAIVTL